MYICVYVYLHIFTYTYINIYTPTYSAYAPGVPGWLTLPTLRELITAKNKSLRTIHVYTYIYTYIHIYMHIYMFRLRHRHTPAYMNI